MSVLKKRSRIKWVSISLIVLLFSGGLFGFVNNDQRNFSIVKSLDIFYTLFRELNSYYVDNTNPEKLIKTGIDSMLASLDPYTTYIPESDMKDFNFMTTGKYGGIGSIVRKAGKYVIIDEPYKGFPAQAAGLKAGDKLVNINNVNVVGKKVEEVSKLLKGPINTPLKLKVERPGTKRPLDFNVMRRKISINPVSYHGMVNDKTGIIMLKSFTENCSDEIAKAFKDLKENQGAKSIIFDLRGNPGGLLNEAIKTVNLFIKKDNEVVSTKGKVKEWDKVYKTPAEPLDTVMPIAVLINSGSASAAEIVSGSLQDFDRAVLIGQRSFGKGLVQSTRNLSYNAKLKVTTAKYYIPSGRCIQALDYTHRNKDGSVGLVPDSLMSEFKTRGGRSVYDGGGVSPDIKMNLRKYQNITYALVVQSMFFDFATEFAVKNKTIDSPDNFKITDDEYNKFIAFVSSKKDFKYKSATGETFKRLVEVAKAEKYYNKNKAAFDKLKTDLSLNLKSDMILFKDEIKEFLSTEILKRYYYQKGAIKYSIKDDKEIDKAVEVLNNTKEYKGLLDGTIASHAGDKRSLSSKS